MKQTTIFLVFVISMHLTFGQNSRQEYSDFVKKADSLYKAKDYKNAAFTFSLAFKANNWLGSNTDRYSAARSWALANNPDSAFFQLYRIATKGGYSDYNYFTTDQDLNSLHTDKRWQSLLDIVKQNKEKADAKLKYKPLVQELDSILNEDQKCRIQIDTIEKKYGWESIQMKAHLKLINKIDSINLLKVKAILDKYGWLGADVIGANGNLTLFLIIQHSDQLTQQKYLPMMREAVKNGKAWGGNLALLEDRVALGQGRRQIYGTQVARDKETNYLLYSTIRRP